MNAPPLAICRGCYGEIPGENNPTLKCPKCGTVNREPDPPPRPQPAKKTKRPMAPAERLLVIVVCIIFFLGALSWLGSHGEGASQSLAFVAISIGGALLYLTPSLVGKDKKNAQAILVLNMFLGWTFIGWVVALVWAYTKDD